MNCRKITSLLSLYATGDLPATDQQRIREHLAVCPDCARVFEQDQAAYTAISRLAASDTPDPLPSDFSMKVQRRIAAEGARSWNPFRGWGVTRLPVIVPAGAAVALIAILLFAVSRAPQTGDQTDFARLNLNGQPLTNIAALAEQHGGEIKGPFPVESWKPSGEPGVYMLMHKPAKNDATESFALDYCGESDRLRSYQGSPWIRQRAGRLIARAGSRDNVYIIVILLPDSPDALRQRIERDIRNEYKPFLNYRNGV